MVSAERLVFEIVPGVLGLFLAAYSVSRIRRMRSDFFTVVRGWVLSLFILSLSVFWMIEIFRDVLGTWADESRIPVGTTFVIITSWLSVSSVALSTRYKRFTTLDHLSRWMRQRPINMITGWGLAGLVILVYAWYVGPVGRQLVDEPTLLTLVLAYLVGSILMDILLPRTQRESDFAPRMGTSVFRGMKPVAVAWVAIPISIMALSVVLEQAYGYDGPNPCGWIVLGLFAAIIGSVMEGRFTALIVDPEVEDAKLSGFRAYDIPRGPYLIEGDGPAPAMRLFSELVTLPLRPDVDIPGREDSASATLEYLIPRGLIVTREYPENVRESYNIHATPIIWLTEMPGEMRIAPTSLAVLTDTIIRFMESTPNSIVILEGVEYLITFNEFKKVLRHLDSLNETTWLTKARMLVTVSPKAYDDKELALLRRDRRVVEAEEGIEDLRNNSKVS